MLTNASLCPLLEHKKPDNVLSGRLLPLNNNVAFVDCTDVSTVTFVEETGSGVKVVAFGAFHTYCSNQAYFVVNESKREYANKFFVVERYKEIEQNPSAEKARHQCFKITTSFDKDVDYSDLPAYYGAFGKRDRQPIQTHVFDNLVKMTLGTYDLDVKMNVTLDLYDPNELEEEQKNIWRDRTGFVVIDQIRLYEITVRKVDLVKMLKEREEETSEVIFEQLTPQTEVHFRDYDSSLSTFSRQDYMDSLLKIKKLKGIVALENDHPIGYALVLDDRLLQCYADNAKIARRLILESCRYSTESMTMFVKKCNDGICDEMLSKVVSSRRIQRFHSRIVPSQVEWAKIFVLNVKMPKTREELFEKAKQLNESEKYDDAIELLKELTSLDIEVNNSEMELINWVTAGKIMSRNAEWLGNYESALYECFSKLNSCVRDEERDNVWCRLKEAYLEVLKAARRVWKEKNTPERLAIYVNLSKLSKFYLDVADVETMHICEEAAKEAKFIGRGALSDDQYRDAGTYINEIKKNIGDAERGKEQLKDS
uniref:KIF-binding protein n=1 Tax=Parascaris univalens TaxID=6257 RepID=A0A915BPK1_PARUN